MATAISIYNPEAARNDEQAQSFLSFDKEKVQIITLDQLRNTQRETAAGNARQPLMGIFHFDLIDRILDMCQKRGLNPEIYDMFAAHNKDGKMPGVTLNQGLEQVYGERNIKAHTLRRVFTNIRLKDFDTDELTTNLAVSFTQKGIQVGMGPNVKICHNQCMLGAKDSYAVTFADGWAKKEDKLDIPQLIDKVGTWLDNVGYHAEADQKTIGTMKSMHLRPGQLTSIIGDLNRERIAHDSSSPLIHKSGIYPLSQTQINDVTEELMKKEAEQQDMTAWDVYDTSTFQYKPIYRGKVMDMPNIMPQNAAMMDFMRKEFEF